ncbi:MAG: S8 family serine peptidase [Candidatus Eremiobacteraeota bacterium]|nr:S8 family serine peptidase [Candidatus Eremiobacteraeota bacterium]
MDSGPSERVTIAGSERSRPQAAVPQTAIRPQTHEPDARVEVTIVVRRRAPLAATGARQTRAGFARAYGADPVDVAAIERFALESGLVVLEANYARRSVVVDGPAAAIAAAFGATMTTYDEAGVTYRARTGSLSVPAALGDIVEGVFGIDERPQARAQFRPAAATSTSYSPVQVADAYGFPADATGAGETIALIELGGGFSPADLTKYFAGLGIAQPTVTAVSVDGAANAPTGSADGPDGEVELDIEIAGAIAPGAKIVVYFAPNTDRGFLDAVTTAIHDEANAPTIVSISWGGPESTWTAQATSAFDAAFADAATLGITVTVAAGDNGSSDGVTTDAEPHVDFPASSPHVLACGGTTLRAAGAKISAETVWNDEAGGGATGGGISAVFPLPSWQAAAGVPLGAGTGKAGRGVPDVSGDADPATGYRVEIDGTSTVFGGTSAVAPLWAALVARLNERAGKRLGFVNPALYANPTALRDIVSGSNGAYSASAGWDACTGLGSPDGAALAALFGTAPSPTP